MYNASSSQPSLVFNSASEENTMAIIRSLKPSKAKDMFGMDTIMLKNVSLSLANPITILINQSITQGEFPNAWKSAIVSPIYKSGDPHSISNYRPISILPVMSKILEKWIAEQIRDHLTNTPFSLHPLQFGFRPNHSTESANCFL